ncbi:uncharacterized protein [Palaemon carinicauda]|uniref:uncharacterized protein n=1 Tax=Palaemon carinicauda TaxID=392227 RepID=UPI0035B62DF7
MAIGTQPGIMYGAPKIQKKGIPLRPILPAINTCSYDLFKHRVTKLASFTVNEYTLENTYEFVDLINSVEDANNYVMCSFDMEMEFFSRYGLPRKIQSDCGSNFTSRVFKSKCAELAIQHITSVPYHPESQGVVERFHQTLKCILKKYCYEQGEDWDKGLPFALFAIRNFPNSSTGVAPFELIFGHKVRGPLEIFHELLEVNQRGEHTVGEVVSELKSKLAVAWKYAKDNLSASQATMKTKFDQKCKVRSFKSGDLVLVLSTDPDNFLEPRYKGPWKVLRKLSEVNYEVEAPGTSRKCKIFHINRLKSYSSDRRDPLAIVFEPVMSVVAPVEENLEDVLDQVPSDALGNNLQNLGVLKEGLEHLEAPQKQDILNLIMEFSDLFQDSPGRTRLLQHDVDVGDASPVKQSPYRLSPEKRAIVEDEIKYMLEHNLIQPSKPFIIAGDASDVGIGGVLFQRSDDGEVRPVSYYSRKLLEAERKYSTIEKEALALVWTLVHFKPYVTNFSFPIEIWTDHNPLVFIERMKGSNQRILRWALQLQEFNLIIKHIKGVDNCIPDALSRV